MAPSAVFAQARKAATNGLKRKRNDAEPDDEVASVNDSEQSDEVDSDDEDNDDDEDANEDEDEHEEEEEDLPVFSRLEKGKDRPSGLIAEQAAANGAGSKSVFRQKTLILSSRGITHRMRHMMKDLASLLPHSKTDAKLDTKHQLSLLNELADLSNCSTTLFFEARRHQDLYMWASMTPNGPSIRFHLLNAHTMDELKMTGNCLKGSRPIVVFDTTFDEKPEHRLMKEVLMQIFAVSKTARRAKPFVDHVTSFSVTDNRIWFRNYQIVHDSPVDVDIDTKNMSEEELSAHLASKAANKGKKAKNPDDNMSMNEIGPRFVLTPVKIFEGSFGGAVVWENKDFISPTNKLAAMKSARAAEYRGRKDAETDRKGRKVYLDSQQQADREKSGKAALDRRRVFA